MAAAWTERMREAGWFALMVLVHPLHAALTWMALVEGGLAERVAINVYQVPPLALLKGMLLIALFRYGLFRLLARLVAGPRNGLGATFLRNHRWLLPCLPIPGLLLPPIELNVFGFIYFPALILAVLLFGTVGLVLNLRTLWRHRRGPPLRRPR
jgi:hypothetical protein